MSLVPSEGADAVGAVEAADVKVLVLGTGTETTHLYFGEPSAALLVTYNDKPVLLIGAGPGTTRACLRACKRLPPAVFVPQLRGHFSAELPTMLMCEHNRGNKMTVYTGVGVGQELLQHRMRELHGTGESAEDVATWRLLKRTETASLDHRFDVRCVKTRHSSTSSFGMVLYLDDRAVLAWGGDTTMDTGVFRELADAGADVLVLHGRREGCRDCAGASEVCAWAARHAADTRVYVTGWGCAAEEPALEGHVLCARKGTVIPLLAERQAQQAMGMLQGLLCSAV